MMGKELKKLSRRELVDIIYQMKKNEQEMQEEISALKAELEDKRIRLSQAGSIAEAATSITNIFSDAQKAADIYLNEISCMKAETEKECQQKIKETNEKLRKLIADGEKQYEALNQRYNADYQKWQKLRCEIEELQKS